MFLSVCLLILETLHLFTSTEPAKPLYDAQMYGAFFSVLLFIILHTFKLLQLIFAYESNEISNL
jgi:hypothetical protein